MEGQVQQIWEWRARSSKYGSGGPGPANMGMQGQVQQIWERRVGPANLGMEGQVLQIWGWKARLFGTRPRILRAYSTARFEDSRDPGTREPPNALWECLWFRKSLKSILWGLRIRPWPLGAPWVMYEVERPFGSCMVLWPSRDACIDSDPP